MIEQFHDYFITHIKKLVPPSSRGRFGGEVLVQTHDKIVTLQNKTTVKTDF